MERIYPTTNTLQNDSTKDNELLTWQKFPPTSLRGEKKREYPSMRLPSVLTITVAACASFALAVPAANPDPVPAPAAQPAAEAEALLMADQLEKRQGCNLQGNKLQV